MTNIKCDMSIMQSTRCHGDITYVPDEYQPGYLCAVHHHELIIPDFPHRRSLAIIYTDHLMVEMQLEQHMEELRKCILAPEFHCSCCGNKIYNMLSTWMAVRADQDKMGLLFCSPACRKSTDIPPY